MSDAADWRAAVLAVQHRASLTFGIDEARRGETVLAMLDNNRRRAPGYWLQLTLAMGIATLGLVLNSTAVVIGAMLVSPLMGPIVELGMGFAVGSAFLVFRAFLRVLLSVLIVIAGAAVITLALPFHELTPELAARAAPTALDLLVAAFCALTAAYTTVRSTSDTTSAAAGTAIGIALVPPLCATGFGLGTGIPSVAAGAALLFTANLSAILVLSVISFLLLGYNQVDAERIENQLGTGDGTRTDAIAARAQRALHRLFGSRYGMAMRLMVPLLFLASVYVPLHRALHEVTWEVRARDAIRRITASEAPTAVQTAVTVERHTIRLRLVIIGGRERAHALEDTLRSRIASGTGVSPDISITAVPDAGTLAAATTSDAIAETRAPLQIDLTRRRADEAIKSVWPAREAGQLIGWRLVVPPRDDVSIVLQHLGPPLGPAADALLARGLSSVLETAIVVEELPLAVSTAAAALGDESRWMATARPILDWLALVDGASGCVRAPLASTRRRTVAQRLVVDSLQQSQAARTGRLSVSDSSGWNIRVVAGRCPAPDSVTTAPAK